MDFGKTKIYLILFIIVAVTLIGFLTTKNYPSQIILGGKVFTVDVADTSFTMNKGYSGHPPIGNNEGMIFVFPENGKHGFWMKDMLFSLDIIWMDENFVINHIERGVKPDTYPKIFYPEKDARYVLEIQAGEVNKLGVKIGDKVKFIEKYRI